MATSLKNMIARPGTFATLFPETTTNDLVAVLADGIAECQLEGLLLGATMDSTMTTVTPDLSSGEQALAVLFSGARIIRAELLNRATSRKYSAGPASAEMQYSAQLLKDILDDLTTQKKRLIDILSQTQYAGTVFNMADQYVSRLVGDANLAQRMGALRSYDWIFS
jgi:hypothetical protein